MGTAIQDAKLFMVGAGGIGCELLKDLVMSGFKDIELIDMDTIDISNLNRQFLFRNHHVGQSKAKVAAAAGLALNPSARIVAHHSNIMAPEFDVDFFSKFNVVLNALDNVAARRHVNRMCLAAGVPLVDSGTAGYLGQVTVHLKGESQCYECEPKSAPKGFPTCTITNTPSKPVHCIVWAKELPFQKLFGDKSAVSDLDTVPASASDAAPGEDGSAGPPAAATEREASGEAPAAGADAAGADGKTTDFFSLQEGEDTRAFARRVFDRLFGENVAETLKMEHMWRTRSRPTPHFLADIFPNGTEPEPSPAANGASGQASGTAADRLGLSDDHAVWTLEENARLFLECVRCFFEDRKADIGSLTFDKDDDLAVQFVVAASNIRSHSFGIPMQSLFQVKGIAGSIIHAIATTNAIVSGLAVLKTIRLVQGNKPDLRTAWIHKARTATGRLLDTSVADRPNPRCHTCAQSAVVLELDTGRASLGAVVAQVLKPQLGAAYPTVTHGDTLLYEEGADLEPEEVAAYTANAKKILQEFNVRHGSVLTVEDYQQHFKCTIHIKHREDIDEEAHPSGMILHGKADEPKGTADEKETAAEDLDEEPLVIEGGPLKGSKAPSDPPGSGASNGTAATQHSLEGEGDDDVVMVDGAGHAPKQGKRKSRDGEEAQEENVGGKSSKKQRTEVVVLDDD